MCPTPELILMAFNGGGGEIRAAEETTPENLKPTNYIFKSYNRIKLQELFR
jgi:hypothetical protein